MILCLQSIDKGSVRFESKNTECLLYLQSACPLQPSCEGAKMLRSWYVFFWSQQTLHLFLTWLVLQKANNLIMSSSHPRASSLQCQPWFAYTTVCSFKQRFLQSHMSANAKGGSIMSFLGTRRGSCSGRLPCQFLPGWSPCSVIPSQCTRISKHSCVGAACQEHAEIAMYLGSHPKDVALFVLEGAGGSECIRLKVEMFQVQCARERPWPGKTILYYANERQLHGCLPMPATSWPSNTSEDQP